MQESNEAALTFEKIEKRVRKCIFWLLKGCGGMVLWKTIGETVWARSPSANRVSSVMMVMI